MLNAAPHSLYAGEHFETQLNATISNPAVLKRKSGVVVVYYVTIVAIEHGLLKKFRPLVLGCVLRTAGSSTI